MNIFKILASGDGTLKEPNISAFLKFLLDPSQTYGLELLKRFIAIFNVKFAAALNTEHTVQLFLEENLTKVHSKTGKLKRNIGDIYIEISKGNELVCLIYVEVKIKKSLNTKLNQVYSQNVDISQFAKVENIPKYYVFLTPEGTDYKEYMHPQ